MRGGSFRGGAEGVGKDLRRVAGERMENGGTATMGNELSGVGGGGIMGSCSNRCSFGSSIGCIVETTRRMSLPNGYRAIAPQHDERRWRVIPNDTMEGKSLTRTDVEGQIENYWDGSKVGGCVAGGRGGGGGNDAEVVC